MWKEGTWHIVGPQEVEAAVANSLGNRRHGLGLDTRLKDSITSELSLCHCQSPSPQDGWGGGGEHNGGFQGNKTNQDFTIKANISN